MPRSRAVIRAAAVLIVCAGAAAAGCRSLPLRTDVVREHALPAASYGSLADFAGRIEAMLPPGESAHWLLDRNQLALTARLALTDEAATSLDVQYFIWQSDATGHLLSDRILRAADRGVRVRVLMDDFGVAGTGGDVLKLDAHPLIAVRVFNPWTLRGSRFGTATEFLARAALLNRRMHNKTFIADGRFAVLGGRNIGDRYFGTFATFVQNDLDVMVAGPLTRTVIETFDDFWNSKYSFPVAMFARDERPHQPIETTRDELRASIAWRAEVLRPFTLEPTDWSSYLEELVATFAPARGEVLWESPDILDEQRPRLYARYKELVASARSELLISSPYFIPDEDFRELLRELVDQGVRVVVVTNSLATNNHVVAHTGYRRWRRDVLAAGVELYELRADAAAIEYYVTPPAAAANLGLHTKAVVVDRARAFVGSPNVDPRSMELNTEIGVVGEGVEFTARVAALIERDIAPENAWRVTMDEEGWLTWSTGDQVVRRQPAKGFLQRAIEFLINLLPLKNQA
ncbi:MAG TPA: phospholipase D family protein [Gammaproteobacteria bacterium]|nr:phospholipase D family protein [Gammaproteobacteria bacterium]